MPDVVERVEDPPDRLVDQLVQVVVEAAVGHVGGLLGEHLRPEPHELLLARAAGLRTSRTATAPRRSRARCRRADRTRGAARRDHPANAMSWGFTNDATASHGPSSRDCGQLAEQLDDLLGEHAVADRARSRTWRRRGARGRSTPRTRTGRADRPCGTPRPRRRWRVPSSSEAMRLSWVPGIEQVGVSDVPLAPVVGLVAAGAEPVAEGGHLVGVEPAHRRVGRPSWPSRRSATRRAATGTAR